MMLKFSILLILLFSPFVSATETSSYSKKVSIWLISDQFKVFEHGGVKFNYPAAFRFKADTSSPGIKIWTLNGTDIVIMLQHYVDINMPPKEFSDQLQMFFKDNGADKPTKISYTFNQIKYSGYRVLTSIGGIKIYQDVLEIPTKQGSRFLMIQDLPPEDRTSKHESELAMKLLESSLEFGAP